MRRNKRNRTTLASKTETKRAGRRLLATVSPLLLGLVLPLLTSNPASASPDTYDPVWEEEIIFGHDINGDGYIGPPPKQNPPPVGGATVFDQIA